MKDWFTVEKIDEDTYAISEYQHWEETHCYLLCGTKRALLIDTGLGVANWRPHFGERLDIREISDIAAAGEKESDLPGVSVSRRI